MKAKYKMSNSTFFLSLLMQLLLVSQSGVAQERDSKAEPFLPEIVEQFPGVRDIAISSDEKEIYFTVQSYLGEVSAIVTCKNEKGIWTAPQVASFSGRFQDLEPFFSADGLRLYFVSDRPLDKTASDKKDYDIWYVDRPASTNAWSEPVNIGAPVNTGDNEFYPSVANSGNLYFTSDGSISKGKDDLFLSKLVNGKYQKPISVSDSINTSGYEFNAFISPDESYLIFTCYNKTDGFGSGDLYISYNKNNGSATALWTSPLNMGKEINSAQMDYCPFVNTKTGVLYFTSKRSAVSHNFKAPQTIQTLLSEMNKYEKGLSRIYQMKIQHNSSNTKK